MLCQTYAADMIPHRTVAQYAEDESVRLFPGATYNADILGADGFECIDTINGLYFTSGGGALDESGVIAIAGWTAQRWWPGWNRWRWEFDAETGEFLRRGLAPGGFTSGDIYQGAGGELWLSWFGLRLLGLDFQPTDVVLEPATYGAISFRVALVDRMRNRIVMTPDSNRIIEVRELDTGVLLHSILPPSHPRDICHEEGSRCYVLTDTRDVLLLDYMSGRWMGAVKLTGISGSNARIGWDKRYRRLIAVEQPVDPIGFTNQVGAVGFAMRPVATYLCTPIPLKRLRAGESVPVLVKAIGDMSEGIPSAVSVSVAGPALSAPRNVVALDGAGEGVATVDALTAGSDTLSISMDVPCLP